MDWRYREALLFFEGFSISFIIPACLPYGHTQDSVLRFSARLRPISGWDSFSAHSSLSAGRRLRISSSGISGAVDFQQRAQIFEMRLRARAFGQRVVAPLGDEGLGGHGL